MVLSSHLNFSSLKGWHCSLKQSLNTILTLTHGLRLVRQRLLHGRPLIKLLHPSIVMRILALDVNLALFLGNKRHQRMPCHERQVGIRAFVADQVPGALLLELRVQHADDALNLLDVSVYGGGELLRVEVLEPGALAVVGSLAGDLEVEPLVAEVLLREAGVADGLALVVGLDQVLVNGTGFPEGEARVGVGDGGDAAVEVDLGDVGGLAGWLLTSGCKEGRGRRRPYGERGGRARRGFYLLQVRKVHELRFVWKLQLFEYDGGFPWIWP